MRLIHRNKLATSLCVVALVLVSVRARAQEAYGPETPVTAADLDAVRAEMKLEAEAAQRRTDADEAAIARLHTLLDEERRAREEAVRAAEEVATHAAGAVSNAPLVRAGRFNLTLSGFMQADATAWSQLSQDQLDPATGNPLNQTRFNIRRARIRAEVDWRWIGGAVEFDGNTNNGYQARIIGAEASFKWKPKSTLALPYLQVTVGSFKIPFGFEVQQADTDRLFLERSNMEKAFFSGEYDLGARLFGGWRFLRYSLAVMNGDPIGEKAFPGRDPNQSKDIIGRIGVETKIAHTLALFGDLSGLSGTGFHSGTPATKTTLFWRDSNQDGAVQLNEISVIPAQPSTPSKNFSRWAVGGDARFVVPLPTLGDLMVYAEVTYAANLDRFTLVADPIVLNRDLRELGWYVGFTQELTQWAAAGVRYDRYDPDRDANDLRNGAQVVKDQSYSTLAVAAAARFPRYARLIAEYDHNTNALGRTAAGLPTTLASDAFTLRAEVRF